MRRVTILRNLCGVLLPLAFLTASCTTTTHQQAQALRIAQGWEVWCTTPAASDPRYTEIYRRLPPIGQSAPAGPDRYPTLEDTSTLMVWQAGLKPCRERRVAASSVAVPSFGPILSDGYASLDQIYESLMSGEFSWAQGAAAMAAVRTKFDSNLAVGDRRLYAYLVKNSARSYVFSDLDLRITDCMRLGY